MKTLIFSLAIISLLAACNKNSDDVITNRNTISGSFAGTFQRTGSDTSRVKISFADNGMYDGESVSPRYPAICGGTYALNGSSITFNDTCNWTADFDWTLILDGSYNFRQEGDSLRIWRTNGGVTDEYKLDRMFR